MIPLRRSGGSPLQALGVRASKLSWTDAIHESVLTIGRQPSRTILAAIGTVLGVAAVVATLGLAQSANGAVSSAFNAELATEVTFQDTTNNGAEVLSDASESALGRLSGVIRSGVMWDLDGGQPMAIRRTVAPDPNGQNSVYLPVTAVSAGALATMRVHVSQGRLYDLGHESRGDSVALLGAAAAAQLGITRLDGSPAVFVGNASVTIIGIVDSAVEQTQALLGLIVPPEIAMDFGSAGLRRVIVQTEAGAAALIGREGPVVLSPFDPSRIEAETPPDPRTLREHVEGSITTLVVVLAILSLLIGMVAIGNITLLSVFQRTQEIGLRRATGARPRHVTALILLEATWTGGIGGLLGSAMGVVATGIVAAANGWTPVIDVRLAVVAPLAGIATGLVAGLYPAYRASRVSPIWALQQR